MPQGGRSYAIDGARIRRFAKPRRIKIKSWDEISGDLNNFELMIESDDPNEIERAFAKEILGFSDEEIEEKLEYGESASGWDIIGVKKVKGNPNRKRINLRSDRGHKAWIEYNIREVEGMLPSKGARDHYIEYGHNILNKLIKEAMPKGNDHYDKIGRKELRRFSRYIGNKKINDSDIQRIENKEDPENLDIYREWLASER